MKEPFTILGQEHGIEDCERLAMWIRPESREDEADLYLTKWFDYRHFHPTQATYYFAHCYVQAVRRIYAKTRDVERAKTVEPFQNRDITQCPEFTACWLARKNFDRIGVRYDTALDFAFKRATDRGWGYFPRPNQLYGAELTADLTDYWQKLCTDVFQHGEHPRFLDENYCGHPDQDAHHQWLIAQVKRRAFPEGALGTLFAKKLLPQDIAAKAFTERVMKSARKICLTLA